MANTDFEGGDNDDGYGDYIFLVKHGQPSHTVGMGTALPGSKNFDKNVPIRKDQCRNGNPGQMSG